VTLRRRRVSGAGLAALLVFTCVPARAADSPAATLVEPGAGLAAALEQYGSVRLRPDADYGAGRATLRLKSGQTLEIAWNARVPALEIPAGVHDVTVTGLSATPGSGADLTFTGGAAETRDVRIVGAAVGSGRHPRILIGAGARVSRLALLNYGGLEVRQHRSGYVRDSTFSRMIGYRPGPLLDWTGNVAEPSSGNAFLGIAAITPGFGARWRRPGDLWLLALDCESWNGGGNGWRSCFTVEDSPRVVSIGLSGGTVYPAASGPIATFRHVQSVLSWFQNGHGGQLTTGDVIVEGVDEYVTVQRFSGTRQGGDAVGLRGDVLAIGPGVTPAGRLPSRTTLDAVERFGEARMPFFAAFPVLRAPRGPAPATPLADAGDAARTIQAQIDLRGVAHLGPGRYLLARPLRLGSATRVEGIVADGDGGVELVAAGAFPIITGRGDFGSDGTKGADTPIMVHFVLSGLRLIGGTEGIRWSGESGNLGPAAQIAYSDVSDVEWQGQSVAAVSITGIFGIDNVAWRRITMRNVPVGFYGRGTGTTAGMNYADKQYFLEAQFENVRGAVWDWRSDRPSGGEIWQDSYFRGVGQLSSTRAAMGLAWVNSVFEDLGESTAIQVADGDGRTQSGYFSLVHCEFRGTGPAVVSDTQSDRLGTIALWTNFAQKRGRLTPADGLQGFSAWSSRVSGGAVPGALYEGVLVRSSLSAELSGTMVLGGGRRVALDDVFKP